MMIPQSKISNLSQGTFVGSVADNFGEEIAQKVFHAKIVVDTAAIKAEESNYVEIPQIKNFGSDEEMEKALKENFTRIKQDVRNIIARECERLGIGQEEKEEK